MTDNRTHYPADGERRAVTGLYAQYRLCAWHIQRALQRGNFEWVELMSRQAEAMDDIVLATTGRLDALQLKHSTSPSGITLASLLKPSADGKPSLIRQLASGWRALKKVYPERVLSARLVFRGIPTGFGQFDSQVTLPDGENFHRFLLEGWSSSKPADLIKWGSLRDAITAEANLTKDEVAAFFSECGIEFAEAMARTDTPWADNDLKTLTHHLLQLAAADVRPEKIDQATLLEGLGWHSRFQIRYSHDWKIDQRYQSIHATTEPLANPQRQRLCTWRTVQRKNAETSSTVQSFSVERGVSMRASMPTAARQLLTEPSGTRLNVGSTRQIRMQHRESFFIGVRFSRDKKFRTLSHCYEGAGWWVNLARLESPELRRAVPCGALPRLVQA